MTTYSKVYFIINLSFSGINKQSKLNLRNKKEFVSGLLAIRIFVQIVKNVIKLFCGKIPL